MLVLDVSSAEAVVLTARLRLSLLLNNNNVRGIGVLRDSVIDGRSPLSRGFTTGCLIGVSGGVHCDK